MNRVTGIGGIFMKARDPDALRAWYARHLGVPIDTWGGAAFKWVTPENPTGMGSTVWSISPMSSDYFAPSTSTYMVNYRVKDVHALVALLKSEGCDVPKPVEESEFGKFCWVMDPEGNKVELWEPPPGM
jgi:predicted enzyme related to lactoylglutathione lyase